MTQFFDRLSPIRDFLSFTDVGFYRPAPEDWLVVIADVEGSTRAIEEGKYKWVNLVGASAVVALVNALETREFPFVFGGDGATALIPAAAREQAERYLRAARRRADAAFRLRLRVGLIPLRELTDAGASVEVARYHLPSGPSIAFFRGDGLELAERWVKSGKGQIAEGPEAEANVALKGLSCRWAPMRSENGVMASIIVKSRQKPAEPVLARVAARMDAIANLDAPATRPVKLSTVRPEAIWRAARAEAEIQGVRPRWLGIAKVIFEMLVVKILDRFGLRLPGLDFRKYKASMIAHSDYRKYDEQLRMVIDCSSKACESIRAYLEEERRAGALYFGICASGSALLTCFLESFEEGGHIHFVDGSDGGYAVAAKELKSQQVLSSFDRA